MTRRPMTPAYVAPVNHDEPPTPLEIFLSQLRGRDDFPSFVKNVEQITEVVYDPKARVQLLNDAISGDVALSAKVLRIANSAIYAAAGRTVETCYQAIMLLGFERMKDIAVGAAVFEHLNGRSPQLKELMATSVLTANQSIGISAAAGFPRAEIAYMCGIFRNLGELVVACYKPKEYAEFRAAPVAEDEPGMISERRAFGFRFDELGQAIAEMWGLPDAITSAIYRPPKLGNNNADGPVTLAAVTQLSADLTQAIYRSPRWQQRARLKTAVAYYGKSLGLSEEDLVAVARTALQASEGALAAAKNGVDPKMFDERLFAMEEIVLGPVAERNTPEGKAAAERREATPTGNEVVGAIAPTSGDGWLFGGIQEVVVIGPPTDKDCEDVATALRGAMTAARPLGTDEAIARTLAALLSVGFQRTALLLSADNHSRMRTRTAIGDGQEFLLDALNVVLQPPNGAIALSVLRREDVFSELKQGSAFRNDPSVKRLRSLSFTMLPVVVGGQPIGALFADNTRRVVDFTPGVKTSLAQIRDALSLALERLREMAHRPAAAAS